MKFNTEKDRLDHPYASLIPYAIWGDLFDSNITDHELKFLEFNLSAIRENREVFADDEEDQLRLWLCVLLGHKDEGADKLAELGWDLELETPILWKAACIANRSDLLQVIVDNLEEEVKLSVFNALLLDDHCFGFRFAAQAGSVEVLKWLKAHSSIIMLNKQLRSDDYYGFAAAAEFGHLPVLQWFKEVTDAKTLSKMIASRDFYAFRVAAKLEQMDVLDWLRLHISDFEEPPKDKSLLLELLRKKDLEGFQVAPSFFSPSTVVKRPASDLVEPESRDNGSLVYR